MPDMGAPRTDLSNSCSLKTASLLDLLQLLASITPLFMIIPMKIPFPRSSVFRSFLLLTVLLLACPVYGKTDRYTGKIWALMDEQNTLDAASRITLAKYPDCDQATVDEKIVEVYRADGTGESQDEEYDKVLTEKGKRDGRTLTMQYDLPYSTAEVVKLEIIKPTGRKIAVDIAANSTVTIDNSQISENIYDPNSKVLEVNIPGLEVGDIIHEVTHTIIQRSIIPGEFNDENLFEDTGYIRHLSYEIYSPLDKPLKHIVLRNEIPGTVHYTTHPGPDNTLVHQWEVSNVPRMFEEPAMPPFGNVLQRVLVSTVPTWQDVSKWYWELSKPHLEAVTPRMKTKVNELTSGAKTDLDKVKALFYYVSQKIRYMGLTPEKDRPGFEPHDVCMTFDKKYGVCRDKAALLVAMLRTAGLNSYPVIISVGSKKDKDIPNAWFNHAIVAVELKKGEYTLMDPTDEHARELLPPYDLDQSYLVARPEGETIQVSPIESPDKNMMQIRTTGTLKASGELDAKSEFSFGGANDDVYRGAFYHMKPDDQRRFFERRLQMAMPGARLVSLKLSPENMLDVSKEIHAEIEFTVGGMTATGSGKAVMSLPWIGKEIGLVNYMIRDTGLDKRKYPMRTYAACGIDEKISLKLGAGFSGTESTPTYTPVDDPCMNSLQSVEAKNGTLECSREFKLKVVEFSPTQYLTLKKTLKTMAYDERKSPVLTLAEKAATTPAEPAGKQAPQAIISNSIILNSQNELDVTDPHNAVYKVKYAKKILTEAGKVREAEIKIDYNPAYEEVHFIHGIVTSKTGQRQEVSKNEMNTMDADWSSSAKRYTGGKIFVANLPGVDIGSTIDVEYEITIKNKSYLAGFEPFQTSDELLKKSFVLKVPARLKIEKMLTPGTLTPTESRTDDKGTQVYQWTVEKMKALPNEQQLPPDWICTPGVSYFVGDFKAYLKELSDTLQNRSQSGPKAEKIARQITASAKSHLEAVRAIRDFVAKSVRHAGPPFTRLPLSELSTADTTLADGYGHEADRAILLHAMLSAAGFKPEFVLASGFPSVEAIQKTATTFPLPQSYDTPLIKLTLDGVTYYLNDTDQYAQLGSTAHDDCLGIDLPGQTFEVIQAAKDCHNKTDTLYTLTIADNGKLHLGITRHYYGEAFGDKNRFFSELLPEERKRYYQELVSDIAEGTRPVGDLTTQFASYPGTMQFTVEIENFAVVDGKYLYFDFPFKPSLFDLPAGNQRTRPFLFSQEDQESTRAEITLPPGFRNVVISPKSKNLDAPDNCGTVKITSSSADRKFIFTDEQSTTPAIIQPQDYPAILKVASSLKQKSSTVFLLQKK